MTNNHHILGVSEARVRRQEKRAELVLVSRRSRVAARRRSRRRTPRADAKQEVIDLNHRGRDVAPARGRADAGDLKDVLRQSGREGLREAVGQALCEAGRVERRGGAPCRGAARQGEGGLAKGRVGHGDHGRWLMRMSKSVCGMYALVFVRCKQRHPIDVELAFIRCPLLIVDRWDVM